MALVTMGSLRSSAVSTTALLLARRWPVHRSVLLAELDPAGGMLSALLGLRSDPGLQSLAAGVARRGLGPAAAHAHAQLLGANSAVLLAPAAAEQVRDALSMLGDLEEVIRGEERDVICDCGRLDVASPVQPLFAAGELAILVVRSELADLRLLDASLGRRGLRSGSVAERLRIVLLGSGPYGAEEVTAEFAIPVLATLPIDPTGVRALYADDEVRGLRGRSRLSRAGTTLAARIVDELEPAAAVAGFDPVADAEELLR